VGRRLDQEEGRGGNRRGSNRAAPACVCAFAIVHGRTCVPCALLCVLCARGGCAWRVWAAWHVWATSRGVCIVCCIVPSFVMCATVPPHPPPHPHLTRTVRLRGRALRPGHRRGHCNPRRHPAYTFLVFEALCGRHGAVQPGVRVSRQRSCRACPMPGLGAHAPYSSRARTGFVCCMCLYLCADCGSTPSCGRARAPRAQRAYVVCGRGLVHARPAAASSG
jgi:hypothetical protein